MPEEKSTSHGVDRAGLVVTGVLGLAALAVEVAPKTLIEEEWRGPLFRLFICLAALVLGWGVYPYFRDLIAGAVRRRKEESDLETDLAGKDDDALRSRLEKSSALRRAQQLPPVKVKPSLPPPSPLKAPTAAQNATTKDKIEITLKQPPDYTFAFLDVTNRGDDAIFWASLTTDGPVIGPRRDVFALWEHKEDERALIPHDYRSQFRIGRLATGRGSFPYFEKMMGLPLEGTWYIPYSLDGKAGEARAQFPTGLNPGIDKVVVKVTIFTDPPMREGPIFVRVSLETAHARLLT